MCVTTGIAEDLKSNMNLRPSITTPSHLLAVFRVAMLFSSVCSASFFWGLTRLSISRARWSMLARISNVGGLSVPGWWTWWAWIQTSDSDSQSEGRSDWSLTNQRTRGLDSPRAWLDDAAQAADAGGGDVAAPGDVAGGEQGPEQCGPSPPTLYISRVLWPNVDLNRIVRVWKELIYYMYYKKI